MGGTSGRNPSSSRRNVSLSPGARVVGARTAAGIGRLRNRNGGLTTMANRARANRRRLAGRPRAN